MVADLGVYCLTDIELVSYNLPTANYYVVGTTVCLEHGE
jgi:hypothetical protein